MATSPVPLADIASISWQYRPPSDDHAGLYFVAVADNNAVALLQVTSRPGDNLIDDRLARPVADTLGTALTLIRAAN